MEERKTIGRMIVMGLALVFVLGFVSHALAASAYWEQVVAKAKQEGEVVLYGTLGQKKAFPAIAKIMREKYGIRADMVRLRGGQAFAKIEAEMAAGTPIASFMCSGASQPLSHLDKLQPIGDLPETKDPKAIWAIDPLTYSPPLVSVAVSPEGIIVNTELVPPGTEPKTWKELADPKWRGKFVLQDPRRPGLPPALFGFLVRLYGEEWMKKVIVDNKPIITREGRMITPRLVRGEYPMFVAGIYRYLHVILEAQPQVPAVFIVPEEGTYSSWTTFGLLKNAPHPNAARVFLNECLTIEGQKAMADEGYIPVRAGVPLKYPQFQDPTKIKHLKPYPPPAELLMKEPAAMRKLAKKIMGK